MKKYRNIPIFVPHEGCPHDCVFCNQKKIAGAKSAFDEKQVREQIETYLSSVYEDVSVQIAFFGGSFTGIEWDVQKKYLEIATEYIERYGLDGIRMSTRPDMINQEVMERMKLYPIKVIELGVQSMDEEVLALANRGHNRQDVYEACKWIRSYNIELGLQMMLGLPGDTPEKCYETGDQLIALDPDMIRIYPTLVIKDTDLERDYIYGDYQPYDLETTVEVAANLVERFHQAGITVLRIGLQTTEDLQLGRDVVGGPYHPAIGQLVDERRKRNQLLEWLEHYKDIESVTVEANQKLYQSLIGHKKGNMDLWDKHLPKVVLKLNRDLEAMKIKIQEDYYTVR